MMTIVVPGASCAAVFFAGGLIHTARGKSAGCDRPLTTRSGCAAYAAASTCWRCARTVGAWPKCTTAGVRNPRPLWRCSWLYQGKKTCPNARPSSSDPKRSGNYGQYLSVLHCASENGLSFDTCGRLWVLVTPRSASNSATGLLFMDDPRSAWSVSWPG